MSNIKLPGIESFDRVSPPKRSEEVEALSATLSQIEVSDPPASPLSMRTIQKKRLEEATQKLSELETNYRRHGLAYHKLPLPFRQSYTSKNNNYLSEFSLSKNNKFPARIIPCLREARDLLVTAKKLIWRFAVEEAEPVIKELFEVLNSIEFRLPILEVDLKHLEEIFKKEHGGARPLSEGWQEGLALSEKHGKEKQEEFPNWVLELPEVQDNVEMKWGQDIKSLSTEEAFDMAIEVMPEIADLVAERRAEERAEEDNRREETAAEIAGWIAMTVEEIRQARNGAVAPQ